MQYAIQVLLGSVCAVSSVAHASEPIDALEGARLEQRSYFAWSERRICEQLIKGQILARTELLFGLSRANAPEITEEEFKDFIDSQVTPRFRDGLTLLTGHGQFEDSTGHIIQEGSKLLILLYPFSKSRSALVDEIRAEYKNTFQQESVLRTDALSCVSF